MKTLLFKTNIKCAGCVSSVTPYLNEAAGIGNWKIDLDNPERTLIVNSETLTAEEIIENLKLSGYRLEKVG